MITETVPVQNHAVREEMEIEVHVREVFRTVTVQEKRISRKTERAQGMEIVSKAEIAAETQEKKDAQICRLFLHQL